MLGEKFRATKALSRALYEEMRAIGWYVRSERNWCTCNSFRQRQ